MSEKDPKGIENVEVEALSDEDLESIAGGDTVSNAYSACCTSNAANACCPPPVRGGGLLEE